MCLWLSQVRANGLATTEVRHEPTLRGTHHVHVQLHGASIKGSPVAFEVLPAAPEPQMCTLTPPRPEACAALPADYDHPTMCIIKVKRRDRPCLPVLVLA